MPDGGSEKRLCAYHSWVTLTRDKKPGRADVRLMEPVVHFLAMNDVFAAGPNPGRPLMKTRRPTGASPADKLHKKSPQQAPQLNDLILEQPTIAGEPAALTLHLLGGDQPAENVQLTVHGGEPHMEEQTVDVGTLPANQGRFVHLYLDYPQPGSFTGEVTITHEEGEEAYEFTAEVEPNPEPAPPVLYTIPNITMSENSEFLLDLEPYATDVNEYQVNWSPHEAGISSHITVEHTENETEATVIPDGDWTGEGFIRFRIIDDEFFIFFSNYVSVFVVPNMDSFQLTPNLAQLSETITAESTYNDQDGSYILQEFYGVSTSPTMENCNALDQSGCLAYAIDTTE
ncbi:MAG: hypothetical protein U5L09_11370 [Bacteroidales bacterium]|nr:hypothetical protein [Bacteroidales bacterium]